MKLHSFSKVAAHLCCNANYGSRKSFLFQYVKARKNQLIMRMNLILVLLCVGIFHVSAENGFAQRVTLDKENTSLKEIFDSINQQTGIHFIYNTERVEKVFVDVQMKNKDLSDAMDQILMHTRFTYKRVKDNILVKEKPGTLPTAGKRITETPEDFTEESVQKAVSGRVIDEKGEPLIGVSIVVKGTTQGTVSDASGAFQVNLKEANAILVFSYVGYQSQEIRVGDQSSVTVTLKEDLSSLEEVVVVGYGVQKRSETTGSIANVQGDELAEAPVQSFESALNGMATGVNMTANAGVLNQAPVFRIRGNNSLSLSSYPLIVIDGVPTFTSETESNLGNAASNPLSALNPADIESIDVAKDAAATSIYGSRAANGVVFVTTKRGKRGKAKVTYDGYFGLTTANRLPELLNAAEYIEIKNEGLRNEQTFDATNNYYDFSLDNQGNPIDTRWYDYIYQTGQSQNHSLSISGASESTRYYGSIGYTKQNGIFQNTAFDRKSAMFNVDNETTSWLSIGAKINYVNESNASAMSSAHGNNSSASGGMARLALMTSPLAAPFNNDGTYNTTSSGFVGLQDNLGHLNQSRLGFYNPVLSMAYNHSGNKVNNIQSNAFIDVKPVSWLSLRSLFGIDYRYMTYNNYSSPLTGEGVGNGGSASSAHVNRERWVWTNTLTIDKTLNEDHSINFLLGQEQQKTGGSQFGLQRTGQTDPFYSNIQGGWRNVFDYNTDNRVFDNYLFSLFTRLQYNYQQKYFVTANLRQDEYSALGINNKKGTFWGFSAGWEVMKEHFWEDLNWDVFSSLKLRASYGKVGNIGGLSDFGALNTYSAALYGGEPGLVYSATGNPNLQWETSKKLDLGIDFGLLDNAINGSISYYKNDIDGLIFGVPLPPSVGIPNRTNNSILQNVGTMYNQGLEVALSGTPVHNDHFSWTSSLNVTTNKNQVTSLADGVPSIIVGATDAYSITLPGYSAGMLYAIPTAGIDPQTGRRVFINHEGKKVFYQHVVLPDSPSQYQWSYEDGSQASAITPAADAIAYKNSAPKVFGGWNNSFQYGNFELNILLTYQLGGYMMNGTQATMRDQRFWNNSADVLRRWQKPGDQTDIARVVNGDNVSAGNSMPMTENISSTDFLRLKNVMLSYRLPSDFISKAKLNNARVYVSGQNLALLTKYTGMDPEVTTNGNNPITQGIDKNQAPNARVITFGLSVDF